MKYANVFLILFLLVSCELAFSFDPCTRLTSVNGVNDFDLFGWSVAAAGDINGDGYDDFIVGTNAGNSAYVFSGKDNSVIYIYDSEEGGTFGWAVASGGDIDGDGYSDL